MKGKQEASDEIVLVLWPHSRPCRRTSSARSHTLGEAPFPSLLASPLLTRSIPPLVVPERGALVGASVCSCPQGKESPRVEDGEDEMRDSRAFGRSDRDADETMLHQRQT